MIVNDEYGLSAMCDVCKKRQQKVDPDTKRQADFLTVIGWQVDGGKHTCPFCGGPEFEKRLMGIFNKKPLKAGA